MKKNLVYKIALVILSAIILFCGYQIGSYFWQINESKTQQKKLINEVTKKDDSEDNEEFSFSKSSWESLKAINPDFQAYFYFPDYISEPIVKGPDNEYYLNHDINKYYNDFGTVFMSAENETDDQNISLYGHNVLMSGGLKFTPLTWLVEQKQLDEHDSFKIYWQDRCAEYGITHVYYYNVVTDLNFGFDQKNFNEDENEEFIKSLNNRSIVKAPYKLETGDKFVTLVTCKDLNSDVRILIVAKELSSSEY